MRDSVPLIGIVVGIAVLVAAVSYLKVPLNFLDFSKRSAAYESTEPPKPEPPAPAKQNKPTTTSAAARARRAGAMRDADVPVQAGAAATPVALVANAKPVEVVPVKEFPPASEVKRGLNRTQLKDLLGDPELKTFTVNRGTLSETYIYHRKSGGTVVFAHLRDGRVDRVEYQTEAP